MIPDHHPVVNAEPFEFCITCHYTGRNKSLLSVFANYVTLLYMIAFLYLIYYFTPYVDSDSDGSSACGSDADH